MSLKAASRDESKWRDQNQVAWTKHRKYKKVAEKARKSLFV